MCDQCLQVDDTVLEQNGIHSSCRIFESDKENSKAVTTESQGDSEDNIPLIQLRRSTRANKGKRTVSPLNISLTTSRRKKENSTSKQSKKSTKRRKPIKVINR